VGHWRVGNAGANDPHDVIIGVLPTELTTHQIDARDQIAVRPVAIGAAALECALAVEEV